MVITICPQIWFYHQSTNQVNNQSLMPSTDVTQHHFDSEDVDYCSRCRKVSRCQQQPHLGLRSPGRSYWLPICEMTPGFKPVTD